MPLVYSRLELEEGLNVLLLEDGGALLLFHKAPIVQYSIELRDSSGNLVAILENAYAINYSEAINQAPTLSFRLPADDTKGTNITLANEIWLRDYDTGTIVNRFRLSQQGDTRR